MPAFAVELDSPKPTKANYNIIINIEEGGTGSYDIIKSVDDSGDEIIQVHAVPDEGYEFDGWVVDNGNVTGDLSDPDAQLTVSSDVKLTAKFKQTGVEPTEEQPTKKVTPSPKPGKDIDKGSKSPQTGSDDAVTFAALSVVALALVSAAVIAKKASKK